jgi:quercetin dioxygenase-like cupin family protein
VNEDEEDKAMDVRSIEDVEPVVEHNGTVPVWWLFKSREMKDITEGGFLELVNEFEVAGGGYVDPHSHPTHEFYYVLSGRGTMTIDGEDREIAQGDLVHIPPDKVHSLRPVSDHAPIHCFCFAIGVKGSGPIDYTNH